MKTFLKSIGLVALFALAAAPVTVFAQDDNALVPQPDQPVFQGYNAPPVFAPDQAPAQSSDTNNVTFQDFYNQLSSQGTWIKTDNYGDVWQPTESDPNWRPYTYGQWVNTDQGMMWNSNEPFGWATYHYGRWVNLANVGWVWVPGYTWAPAWVSWREGDDYTGWAPLPPDTLLGIDFFDSGLFAFGWSYWGFHIGDDCDLAYGIGPGCYNFCPVAYLGDSHPWRHFADHRDNFALINHTRNVTNLNVSNDPQAGEFGRVHSGGPGSAVLAQSRTPVRDVRLTSASSLAANGERSGNSLAVYAPNVRASTDAHPSRVGANLGNVTVNRGTDITKPLAVNSRVSGAVPTSEQVQAARLAATNAPSDGRIAHTGATFSKSLNQPLGAYHPNSAAGTNFRPATTTTAAITPASTFHASSASSTAFTGEPAVHHTSTASQGSSFFGGIYRYFTSSGSSSHESSYHSSPAPTHYSGIMSYFHSSPSPTYHSSVMPSFHTSSFAYHPQSGFHSSVSAAHFGGGASHFSGGGPSHSSGGGHSGGGDKHH